MATQTRNKAKFQGPPSKTYGGLVKVLPPRPLHDRVDYDNAVEMIGRLAGYDLNADQEDYLEAMAVFVERYEAEHAKTRVDTSSMTGLDVLSSLMEDHGMSGADLSRLLGASRTLGPMVLRGERKITATHARILGERFKLDPGVFIR